jgi:NADPH2:quinone reductase
MRAIRIHEFGGPEQLKLETIPDPVPTAGQVLVRLHAAGVNPVDTYIRSGVHAVKPSLPYTPGSDGAGEVDAVGDGVAGFSRGARVYVAGSPASGTYAERAVCAAAQVHPLPDNVSFAQGAALGVPYATAYRALFQRAQARAGETVLVHGATGGVGIAAVELAHAHGLRVVGTGGTNEGRAAVREHGADVVLDHRAPDYTQGILDATGGKGVDVILEMLANVNLDRDLNLVAKGGRVVVVGNRGRIEINPRDAMNRDATILGMMLFNASGQEVVEIHAALHAGLANGTLRPIVRTEIPLADAARAHDLVMQSGALGKIALIP